MIPLLLISNDPKSIQDYVDRLKEGNLFFEVSPSTKEYSIDDIKNIIKETKIFYPKTRIYFLPNFHFSSIPAQNSFLKLLEEPPKNVQFILSCKNENNLLATVISRMKIVKLESGQTPQIDKDLEDALNELVKNKNLSVLNKSFFSQVKKEEAFDILNRMIRFFENKLASDKKSPMILKEILEIRSLLENNNLNPQLTIDQLLIFIWKQYIIKK